MGNRHAQSSLERNVDGYCYSEKTQSLLIIILYLIFHAIKLLFIYAEHNMLSTQKM